MAEFVCEYCEREFKRESAFLKHNCKEKERTLFLDSFDGKRAYLFYELWMRAYNRSVPSRDVFLTSQFFSAFSKFASYVKRVNLYAPEQYIKLMREHDISPNLWLNSELYDIYHTWLDHRYSPIDQVNTSVDTIFKLMEIFNSQDAATAIRKIQPRELIELLRNRKISVYLLLCSKVFKEQIGNMDEEEQRELGELLNVDYVSKKFDNEPELLANIKSIVNELGI
jgi:hypothetical protein